MTNYELLNKYISDSCWRCVLILVYSFELRIKTTHRTIINSMVLNWKVLYLDSSTLKCNISEVILYEI